MKLHLFCKPEVHTTEGADHIGFDAFMSCPTCRKRTLNHVECLWPTQDVARVLKREWRAGRLQQQEPDRE